MKYITIQKDGSVTGDVGGIVGYSSQQHSDTIKFSYPPVGDEELKYVEYTWGSTRMQNMLEADDTVKLVVMGSGIVTAQFFTVNVLTGERGIVSKPFQLIIHAGLDYGADTFSNCYRKGCTPTVPPSNSQYNYSEMMIKFGVQLTNEMKVRAEQDSAIWKEILQLKDSLLQAGIQVYEPVEILANCDELTTPSQNKLKKGSLNTPEGTNQSNNTWVVNVEVISSHVVQTAYSETGGNIKMYYRTGSLLPDEAVSWQSWVSMIQETNTQEL